MRAVSARFSLTLLEAALCASCSAGPASGFTSDASDGAPFTEAGPACPPGALDNPPVCPEDSAHAVQPAFCDGSVCTPIQPIDVLDPILDCVLPLASGQLRALFGYRNRLPVEARETRLVIGENNRFSPTPAGRGQPENFLAGEHHQVFAADFTEPTLDWFLGRGRVTASASSPVCPDAACPKLCPTGAPCVAGVCVVTCGDGLCAESCRSCEADCGCNSRQRCDCGYCATPMQCGLNWECGCGFSAGVAVDCGDCPLGQTCVSHRCR